MIKKLLMMSAVAAMAAGANAAEYLFNLTVSDIPKAYASMDGSGGVYLIDPNQGGGNGTILAYGLAGEWDKYTPVEDSTGTTIYLGDGVNHAESLSYKIGNDTYSVAAHTMSAMKSTLNVKDSTLGSEYKNVTFNIHFTTDDPDTIAKLDQFVDGNGKTSPTKELVARLYDPTSDPLSIQFDQVSWTRATKNTVGTFQVDGTFAVPEPTSGLLVLLGMAGLALRRRKAA